MLWQRSDNMLAPTFRAGCLSSFLALHTWEKQISVEAHSKEYRETHTFESLTIATATCRARVRFHYRPSVCASVGRTGLRPTAIFLPLPRAGIHRAKRALRDVECYVLLHSSEAARAYSGQSVPCPCSVSTDPLCARRTRKFGPPARALQYTQAILIIDSQAVLWVLRKFCHNTLSQMQTATPLRP